MMEVEVAPQLKFRLPEEIERVILLRGLQPRRSNSAFGETRRSEETRAGAKASALERIRGGLNNGRP
jgi:hypothetical protein